MTSKKLQNFGQPFGNALPNNNTETIMEIKGRLMCRDPASRLSAVTWIRNHLIIASDKDRERLIEALFESDVVVFLCKILGGSNGEIFTMILDIVDKLRFNVDFYMRNLAEKAVQWIFRKSYFLMKKPEKNADILTSVTYTVYAIVHGAAAFDYSISKTFDLDNMILFLKELKPSNSPKYVLREFAAKLLCLVMNEMDLMSEKKTHRNLFTAFKDSLLSISEMIDKHKDCNDDPMLHCSMGMICSVCAAGSRFCSDNDIEAASTTEEFGGAAFTKAILETMVETVIPHFKAIPFKEEDSKANLRNIVKCLEHLMQLKCCDTVELTNSLVTNGYLKYLLTVPFSSRVRDSLCSLISEVIANLSRDYLANEDTPDNRIELRNYIYSGIIALPTKMDHFDLVLKHGGIASDVLAILMYHHFRGTAEHSFFSLPAIMQKLHSVTDEKLFIVVKAVWLLFAVSSLKHSEAQSVPFYSEAVKHLTNLLPNTELEKFYTHHPAIVEHGLVYEGFPVEIRCEIIRLWLHFDGDTGTLLKTEKLELITDCLVSIVERSSEKVVKRALKCIDELKSNKRCSDRLDAIVWEVLSRVLLSFCITRNYANAKGILQLAEETKLKNCDKIDGKAAILLVNLLLKEVAEEELKILLVNHVHRLLDVSSARSDTEAIKICLNDPELVTTLLDEGLSKQNFQLSAACLNLVAFIVECQAKLQFECNDRAIVKLEPLKMLVLLARKRYNISCAAMKLLSALLNCENVIVEPIVSLNDFEDGAAAEKVVFAWYRQLHLLHSKALPENWDLVFRCLIAVLRFCHHKKLAKLLRDLCDYSGNYYLIEWTITEKYSDRIFVDFTETWTRFCIKYRAPNWIHSAKVALPGNEEKSLGPTQFNKTQAMLTKFWTLLKKS